MRALLSRFFLSSIELSDSFSDQEAISFMLLRTYLCDISLCTPDPLTSIEGSDSGSIQEADIDTTDSKLTCTGNPFIVLCRKF